MNVLIVYAHADGIEADMVLGDAPDDPVEKIRTAWASVCKHYTAPPRLLSAFLLEPGEYDDDVSARVLTLYRKKTA